MGWLLSSSLVLWQGGPVLLMVGTLPWPQHHILFMGAISSPWQQCGEPGGAGSPSRDVAPRGGPALLSSSIPVSE